MCTLYRVLFVEKAFWRHTSVIKVSYIVILQFTDKLVNIYVYQKCENSLKCLRENQVIVKYLSFKIHFRERKYLDTFIFISHYSISYIL